MSFAQVEIAAMAMHIPRPYTLAPVEGKEIVHRCDGVIASFPHGLPVWITAGSIPDRATGI